MGVHWQEIIVLLIIALVIFGPKRLPEIGGSLGRGVREFKDSLTGDGRSKSTAAGTTAPATDGDEKL